MVCYWHLLLFWQWLLIILCLNYLLTFFIPMKAIDNRGKEYSPVKRLEHSLHPSVAYAILPIFAFANAGVSLEGLSFELLMEPVTLGIIAGLFIGTLAFIDQDHQTAVRLGVIVGSLLSGVIGYAVLRASSKTAV